MNLPPLKAKRNPRTGGLIHYGSAALIVQDDSILLLNRPYSRTHLCLIHGHQLDGESPQDTLTRKILEHTDLDEPKYTTLATHQISTIRCRYESTSHVWTIYQCEVSRNEPEINEHPKQFSWHPLSKIPTRSLDRITKELLTTLGIIT